MPHLRFRAVEEADVKAVSEPLAEALSFALNTPIDYFTFEHIKTTFYFGGEIVKAIPTIEVLWFDRGQEAQDLTAQMLHESMLNRGYEETTICFIPLEHNAYYDNGQHY
jgi:hypothetical protein